MNKLLALLAIVAVATVTVQAQTTSANIVGYSKLSVTGGSLTLAALAFDGLGTVEEIIGDQLGTGSKVFAWSDSAYVTVSKTRGGWSPANTNVLQNGVGFWILPGGSASSEIVISGEVLTSATADSVSLAGGGVELVGNPYPVSSAFQDMDLSTQLATGDKVFVWNGNGYDTISRTRGGWDGNPTIGIGEGFWVSPAATRTWEESRPFNID
jgi:hypothetical protein